MEGGAEPPEWLGDYILQFMKSPTWAVPIMTWIDENCIVFDCEEENKFEYTTLHKEFKDLVDNLLAAHLLEINVTVEQFEEFCEHASPEIHHLLVEQLLSVENFLTFKAMMVKRNVQQEMECLRKIDEQTAAGTVVDQAVEGAVPLSPESN